MKKRLWWVIALFLVILGILLAFMLSARPVSSLIFWKKEIVKSSTVVTVERAYICGERERLAEGPVPKALISLDVKGLKKRYPEDAGWSIDAHLPAVLYLTCRTEDFCPRHKLYRHIGLDSGHVAIFEGPLGFNQKLLRRERRLVQSSLTPTVREKLEKAMNFQAQSPAIKAVLRREIEFENDSQLNAALENLDELQE
ncbi:MAG: hypothetical protein AB1500_02295 [Bacillota bacterium]